MTATINKQLNAFKKHFSKIRSESLEGLGHSLLTSFKKSLPNVTIDLAPILKNSSEAIKVNSLQLNEFTSIRQDGSKLYVHIDDTKKVKDVDGNSVDIAPSRLLKIITRGSVALGVDPTHLNKKIIKDFKDR